MVYVNPWSATQFKFDGLTEAPVSQLFPTSRDIWPEASDASETGSPYTRVLEHVWHSGSSVSTQVVRIYHKRQQRRHLNLDSPQVWSRNSEEPDRPQRGKGAAAKLRREGSVQMRG